MALSKKLIMAGAILVCGSALAGGKASRVVLVVWDGMRPDMVTEQTTPTLAKLAKEGVTFNNHHAVFLSSTEVNGTVLATGVYPEQSGVIGNSEFRPAINVRAQIATESADAVHKGDKLTGEHYLRVPTLAELLHSDGRRTVIAGAKPVVFLHDRFPRDNSGHNITLFEGNTLPERVG